MLINNKVEEIKTVEHIEKNTGREVHRKINKYISKVCMEMTNRRQWLKLKGSNRTFYSSVTF